MSPCQGSPHFRRPRVSETLQTLSRQEENLTMANQESTSQETTKLNFYEQKQEQRRERLLDAADKAARKSL